ALFLSLSCRHATIAKYFGDATPQCNKCCDYCKNPASVKKQLEALERCTNSWSRTCIGSSACSSDPELYEGGRRGYGGFSKWDEDGRSVDEAIEENRKKEWNNFYKQQMMLRKGSKEAEKDNFVPPDADCPLKDAASRKIARITVKAREHCLKMLEEALSSNLQARLTKNGSDPLTCAVEMEYEAFQMSKTANLYKAAVLKKVAEINKASKDGELYSMLALGVNGCPSVKAEPTTSADDGCHIPSKVNTFKPKRVGIGFRKSSDVFQPASEVLIAKEKGEIKPDEEEMSPNWEADCSHKPEAGDDVSAPESKVKRTKEISRNAGEVLEEGQQSTSSPTASLGVSPTKKSKPTKKQLLLAEAARKESQNISKFFSSQKTGSKALDSALDVAEEEEEETCYLSERPLSLSQRLCEEKEWPETKMISKEERAGASHLEKQELGEIGDSSAIRTHNSETESSCPGSPHGKSW
ncbi:ATP-dependent DNA helicase Q5-like, partial [Sphaerodactylus townsendi]|uniref:ATP-dependent DNA helicase Q5-like n=1 Tax=Sphaerodactylus townsendi TaxID=933632 RepID=UPI00202634F5